MEILSKQLHSEKDHGKPVLGVSDSSRLEYIIFPSITAASKAIGVQDSSICRSMRRTTNKKGYGTCKGYRWIYLDSVEAQKILSSSEYINPQPLNLQLLI